MAALPGARVVDVDGCAVAGVVVFYSNYVDRVK
jgi:hypothetical protein